MCLDLVEDWSKNLVFEDVLGGDVALDVVGGLGVGKDGVLVRELSGLSLALTMFRFK